MKPPDEQFALEHAPAPARSAPIEMADVEGHGRVIGRRMFVTLVTAGLVGRAWAVGAQPATKMPRVTYLGSRQGLDTNGRAFAEGLRAIGRVPAQTVVLDMRTFDVSQPEGAADTVKQVVAAGTDVILASSPLVIEAALRATRTVPIVGVDIESDPIVKGWVATMARPGGNFTGFFLDAPEISGKQLQFLKELRGGTTRVAVLGDPRINDPQFRAIEGAARQSGIALQTVSAKTADEIEPAVAEAARRHADALVVLTSPLVFALAPQIAASALKHHLPSICPFAPRFADAGGLMAYGPDLPDLFRRAADYVDRVLKGAKPGELPVQRPEKFLLVANGRTARALKLSLPTSLVQRANTVIE
jgi:putative tryptophan/tyrosine transport system substrate-binding protein